LRKLAQFAVLYTQASQHEAPLGLQETHRTRQA
jgi:hypothetical protein